MKIYSFVRENVEKVRAQCNQILGLSSPGTFPSIRSHSFYLESKSNETSKITCPDFSQYLYFLFAPTLIYCDRYPRNTMINWGFVLQMFAQVFGAIVYVYYIVVRFCVPTFANLNQSQITLPIFLTVLFNSIMPGSLFLLLGRRNEWIFDH